MDIIIFAMISGFLFYKLYNILGQNNMEGSKSKSSIIDVTPKETQKQEEQKLVMEKSNWPHQLKQINEFDANFSETNFLIGAKAAYEMIFEAYNKADQSTLKYLLSDELYKYITDEILKNTLNNKEIEKLIIALDLPSISEITVDNTIAYIDVIYKGEQMIIDHNLLDQTSSSRKIKFSDRWRFMRDLKSHSPNWELVEMK